MRVSVTDRDRRERRSVDSRSRDVRPRRLLRWLVWETALLMIASVAGAQAPIERAATFDVFAFSQDDDPGQRLKAEGFVYGGARASLTLPTGAGRALRANASLGWIDNDPPETLPATIGAVNVTSASAELLTLDAGLALDVDSADGRWTVSPGLFYHHQYGYIVGGIDLDVVHRPNGGDTSLSASWRVRVAFPKLQYWDFTTRGRSHRASSNLVLGWAQTISPRAVTNVSLQLTREIGLLSDPYNYVVRFEDGIPVDIEDERLPRRRDRVQLNARVRLSLSRSTFVGLDASTYTDSWDLGHVAVEPSVSARLGRVVLRGWVRHSDQSGARYVDSTAERPAAYRTQDSDLGSFRTNGGGISVDVAIGNRWTRPPRVKLSAFGLDRTDGLRVAGGSLGMEVPW